MTETRLTLRRLAKRPASALASIAALAFAIGAAAVTWASLDAVLINPLPLKDPDRLFVVGTTDQRGRFHAGSLYTLLHTVRESDAFERTVAKWNNILPIPGRVGEVDTTIRCAFATYDFFEILGVPPVHGRGLRPDEDVRGAAPAALITYRFWRERFNSDPSAVGQSIELKGQRVAIVGILPPRFRGVNLAETVDVYLPFHTIAQFGAEANYFADEMPRYSPVSGTLIIGRVAPGRTSSDALARLRNAAGPAAGGDPTAPLSLLDLSTAAVPESARAGMRNFARLLAATVALLVLIGCVTVGMLLLIRTEARRGEFAMCVALGATRVRLVRSVAIEAMLLAGSAALLAVPVALWLFKVLGTFVLPGNVAISSLELTLNLRLVLVTAAGGLLAALLVSLVAGLLGFRADLADALRSTAGATPRTHRGSRAVLVGLQSAVALTLLAGAGLLARSLLAALSLNPGIDMRTLVSTTIDLRPYDYSPERASSYFDEIRNRLSADPMFSGLTLSAYEGGMSASGRIVVNGVPRRFPTTVSDIRVDLNYFAAMKMQVREGRGFSATDRAGGRPVVVVSESYGRLLGEGASPLGTRIRATSYRPPNPPDEYEVIGVVSDLVTNVSVPEPLVMYLPASQGPPALVRTVTVVGSDPGRAQRAIVTAAAQIDPRVIPPPATTLEQRIARQMSSQTFGATVLGTLGSIAMLLTLLGTYVLAESMAAMRLREMGIRSALGATQRQLGAILLGETVRLVGLGLIGGLLLASLGASTIRSFLFGVQAADTLTLGGVAGAILSLSLIVSLRAALRVARVDVAQVLRQ